jgi:hypothetical protein
MSDTRQVKDIWCNVTNNTVITRQGAKTTATQFTSKSSSLIRWHVVDSYNNAVDLSGCTFTLKIGSDISTPIMTVPDSDFILADWFSGSLANGLICCRVNFNDSAITTYMGNTSTKYLYFSLWATSGGVNYLLAQSSSILRNSIKV